MCRCMSGFTDQFYEEVGTRARLVPTLRTTAPAACSWAPSMQHWLK